MTRIKQDVRSDVVLKHLMLQLKSDSAKTEERLIEVHKDCLFNGSRVFWGCLSNYVTFVYSSRRIQRKLISII